jgi:hypothetical protein
MTSSSSLSFFNFSSIFFHHIVAPTAIACSISLILHIMPSMLLLPFSLFFFVLVCGTRAQAKKKKKKKEKIEE